MTNKNIKLGIVLVILAALAWVYQGPFQDWKENRGQPKNFLAKVDVSEINKIEVARGGVITILEKQNDKWHIGGTKDFFIKDSVASAMVSALETAVKAEIELAGENQDKKAEFMTDEVNGIGLKLYRGEALAADFIVGKSAPDYLGAYVSKKDTDKTYSIKAGLSGAFNQPEWRDDTIFAVAKEKIAKIRFQYPDREFTVEKIDNAWQGTLPYKFEVSEEKINKISDIMSNLSAAQIPDQNFSATGLDKHLIIIQASGEGIDNTLMAGEASSDDENLYYAKRGNSDNIYLITKEQRDELDKTIGGLR